MALQDNLSFPPRQSLQLLLPLYSCLIFLFSGLDNYEFSVQDHVLLILFFPECYMNTRLFIGYWNEEGSDPTLRGFCTGKWSNNYTIMADNARVYSVSPLHWAYDNPEKSNVSSVLCRQEFWPVRGKRRHVKLNMTSTDKWFVKKSRKVSVHCGNRMEIIL